MILNLILNEGVGEHFVEPIFVAYKEIKYKQI